jgi:hypothetical protein
MLLPAVVQSKGWRQISGVSFQLPSHCCRDEEWMFAVMLAGFFQAQFNRKTVVPPHGNPTAGSRIMAG